MFELPEMTHLASQLNAMLRGKTIQDGQQGNSPHKFVWYNRDPGEFSSLVSGKEVGKSTVKGRWMFIPLLPGYVLLLGEIGGKFLYHAPGSDLPEKYHLRIMFTDGSALTALTQMWGAYELHASGQELERQYVKDMRLTPVDPDFTFGFFEKMIEELLQGEKRSVKSLLTQEQTIPGLGNAIAQDILFNARLHPRHSLADLSFSQRRDLYTAILDTVAEAIEKGGRDDELDLFGNPGGYVCKMDSRALVKPCPACGGKVEKINYLGGACYFCPHCQV